MTELERQVVTRILRAMQDARPSAVQKKASYLQGWDAAMRAAERW